MNNLIICGLDECGRGSLAGPLVAAAVVIKNKESFIKNCPVPIRDSKKISKIAREKLFKFIKSEKSKNIIFEIEEISVEDINNKGISWANKQVFLNLIEKIKADQYIIDGNLKFEEENIISQIKADDTVLEVSLASNIAKVYRDNLMVKLGEDYPNYSWHQNAGYGTLIHRQAILDHGPCKHHRTLYLRKITPPR
jgi:ribonuclease HII